MVRFGVLSLSKPMPRTVRLKDNFPSLSCRIAYYGYRGWLAARETQVGTLYHHGSMAQLARWEVIVEISQ